MVFWSYAPHKAENLLPELVRLLDRVAGKPFTWHFEDQPEGSIPTTPGQWSALIKQRRDQEDEPLYLFLDSPDRLSIGLILDSPPCVRNFDVLSIDLSLKHLKGPRPIFGFDELRTLFLSGVKLFQPFRAEVHDAEIVVTDEFQTVRLSMDKTKIPTAIHWFNFFDEAMVKRLGGEEKLLTAPAYQAEVWKSPPGILLILQRELFDYQNPEHRQRYREITKYLELDRLHALYPKRRPV
jgi:hypothetical protein